MFTPTMQGSATGPGYGSDIAQRQIPSPGIPFSPSPQSDGRMGHLPGGTLPAGAHQRPDGRVILADGSTQGMPFHPHYQTPPIMAPHPNTSFPPIAYNNDMLSTHGGMTPGQTPPWQSHPAGPAAQPYPSVTSNQGQTPPWQAQPPQAPGQSYPGVTDSPSQTPPWMQSPPQAASSPYPQPSGGLQSPPWMQPTGPSPSPNLGGENPVNFDVSTLGNVASPYGGGAMTPSGGAGIHGGQQNVNGPGGAGSVPSNPFSTGTSGSNLGTSYGSSAGAPTQNVQGLGQKAHDMGVMNNYGQVQDGKIWMNAGGGGQGAWTNYNPNDQIQKGIADQFSRYGSGWYSGNSGAYGHADDMKPQWQALHPGQTGTQQDYSDLYMGVHPGEQQAAHNAFAAQSSAFDPSSSSYNPNSGQQLTSLNLLAHQ